MTTEAETGGVMQSQARTPGALRAGGGSSGLTTLMSEYICLICLILKPTHLGNSSTHQKLIQRMRKKGKDGEFFSDNRKSRWTN